MAAAAAEFATVFLETSLGTRLVVSFPASATTVADLKRQVSAEHAACFPQTGPIAVKSVQVKHDGSLFHLTDSMAVGGAFRWTKGPWNLLVEVHELRSRPLPPEDVDCGSYDSEQNAGNPVVRNPTHNVSSLAVSEGDGDLAIGDGVGDTPLLNQLDEPHEDVEHASNQLEDENVVPRECSDIYLAAGGSDTPPMDQQEQSNQGRIDKHTMDQRKDGIVETMLDEWSDLYSAAGGSDNAVDLQTKSCEGVKHASGQPEDCNVKTCMLQESSDLILAACESDFRAKNQLNKSHEDVEHALSLCKDGNAKTMLQRISSLDVAAGDGETPSTDQLEKSYEGVKHAPGQLKNGTVKAMFQENSDLNVAIVEEGETPPINQLDESYESAIHASGQCEDGNVKTMPEESSDFGVAASESETPPMNQLDKSDEDVRYTSGQLEDEIVNIRLQKSSDLDESAAAKGNGRMRDQQKDVIAEPRGTEPFQNQEEKSSRIEPENLNSNPVACNQGNCSHDMGEKPSRDQKEPWTSKVCNGESSNGVSDIPPCVHSMDRDNSSNREVNARDEEEPWVAGLCSGESSFKETDVPHCMKSMKEGNKRPVSNDQFLKKRKYAGATATISTEYESCFKRRQRILCARKVPMSKAAKIFGLRS